MTKQTKQTGVALAMLAMVSFAAWPFWKAYYFNLASTALQERVSQLVQENPSLQTAWKVALADGLLTQSEAQVIVESAGEKVEADE